MWNKCNKFWTSRWEPKCLNQSQPYSRYAADIKGASSSESTTCTKEQWGARDKKPVNFYQQKQNVHDRARCVSQLAAQLDFTGPGRTEGGAAVLTEVQN